MVNKVLITEQELNALLPLLDAQVHHISGNTLFVNTRGDTATMTFMVRHIHTENFMDDGEDEEMILVLKDGLNEAWAVSAMEE